MSGGGFPGTAYHMERPLPPSGQQFEIACGGQRATVVEVGGALREYTVGGRPVLDGYPVGEMCNGARGQTLIPWPNRLRDGRYSWQGEPLQLPLTEPPKGNAIHGLVRWAAWSAPDRGDDHVRMTHTLHPQPGYPFALALAIDYRLDAAGLTVATTAANVGAGPAPYAVGAHPYLTAGSDVIDPCTLRLPGRTALPVDDRGIPTGRQPVAGTAYDLTAARGIGGTVMDIAFTDLQRDEDGRARVVLTGPGGGPSVLLWQDEHYGYLEIFTGDSLSQADRRRRGLGVEPMTCPPNEFATGEAITMLDQGESVTTAWGITAS